MVNYALFLCYSMINYYQLTKGLKIHDKRFVFTEALRGLCGQGSVYQAPDKCVSSFVKHVRGRVAHGQEHRDEF